MRCNGAPGTCSTGGVEPREQVVHALEALVFAQVLKPVAASLGPFGDMVVEAVAQRTFAPELAPHTTGPQT